MIYLVIFGLALANDFALTRFYIEASRGNRWVCVGLALGQQLLAAGTLWLNVVEALEPRERVIRLAISALAYGAAAAIAVKPSSAFPDKP